MHLHHARTKYYDDKIQDQTLLQTPHTLEQDNTHVIFLAAQKNVMNLKNVVKPKPSLEAVCAALLTKVKNVECMQTNFCGSSSFSFFLLSLQCRLLKVSAALTSWDKTSKT